MQLAEDDTVRWHCGGTAWVLGGHGQWNGARAEGRLTGSQARESLLDLESFVLYVSNHVIIQTVRGTGIHNYRYSVRNYRCGKLGIIT